MTNPEWEPVRYQCSSPEEHNIVIQKDGRAYCTRCEHFFQVAVFGGGGSHQPTTNPEWEPVRYQCSSELKDYIEQLLAIVADEVNVKEVVLEHEYTNSVFKYDTLYGKENSIDDEWPIYSLVFSGNIHDDMILVREWCKIGLKQRANAKIKVRQPLQSITINLKAENQIKEEIKSLKPNL